MVLEFYSPNSESYNYISYVKKQILTDEMIDSIKSVLLFSNIKQKIEGLPIIENSAFTSENLFIKFNKMKIAGGSVYANLLSFPDKESIDDVKHEIANERGNSFSIDGNYDLLIDSIRKKFNDLGILISQAIR